MKDRVPGGPPRLPLHPKRPESICWGCDRYCPAAEMYCGNGTIRAPHPAELFGEDWDDWARDKLGARLIDTGIAVTDPSAP